MDIDILCFSRVLVVPSTETGSDPHTYGVSRTELRIMSGRILLSRLCIMDKHIFKVRCEAPTSTITYW